MAKATDQHSTPRRRRSPATRTPRASARTLTDPIFAALDNHKKLDRVFLDLEGVGAKQRDVERAGETAERAAWRLARTRPTTAAGAAALLEYVTVGPITGLFELGETAWHETAFRNLAASLAEIARQAV